MINSLQVIETLLIRLGVNGRCSFTHNTAKIYKMCIAHFSNFPNYFLKASDIF